MRIDASVKNTHNLSPLPFPSAEPAMSPPSCLQINETIALIPEGKGLNLK